MNPVPLSVSTLLGATSLLAGAAEIAFNRDIRPILSDRCFSCHGFDAKHREGDRRLDFLAEATAEHDGVRAIVPGDPAKSELWLRLTATDRDEVMPPPKQHKPVSVAERELIRQWIEQGAHYEEHWAFIPPQPVPSPAVKNDAWPQGELDRFILARLEREGLAPSPPASREMLLRRVTLDLTGLPPTPAEVAAFRDDASPKAYEAVVDRLLQSKRYGERMTVEWLDAARYADTHGFNNDAARTMWRWRDWVIDAFNENLPYDRFLTEQLAGDLLRQPTVDQRVATGFGRNHVVNSEGGIIPEEYRVEYVADRVRTTSLAWLGLTVECARCHDHKFDPISQRDYYGLFAFFNNVDEAGEDGRTANAAPTMPAPTREQQAQLAAQLARLTEMDRRLAALKAAPPAADATPVLLAPAATPVLHLNCDDALPQKDRVRFPGAPPQLVEGVAGQAWRAAGAGRLVEFEKAVLAKAKTIALWIKPDAANPADVALLSNATYDGAVSRDDFGRGEEIRLVGGEIEVRINDKFPGYAFRLRTRGAALGGEEWRHLTVVFQDGQFAEAVRVFVDGQELATVTPNVGAKGRQMQKGRFGLGADLSKNAAAYRGAFDELCVYEKPLNDEEVAALFGSEAVTYAASRVAAGSASPRERAWLSDAQHNQQNAALRALSGERRALWAGHLALERTAPNAMVMQELAVPRPAFVLRRGVYDAHGEPVSATVPEHIAPWPKDAPKNRLGLAQWLTQPGHPLTARVVVNRLWAQFFGTGLVKTLGDFGSQGEYPSHPELLDWLARRFVESGWDVKAMARTLALSATYRQASRVTPEMLARDPENRLLARAPRLRLPAEFLRDQALAVSGLLHEQIGGPSVYPAQPADLFQSIVVDGEIPGSKWGLSQGGDLFRRSLYTFWKRTALHPVMGTFDAPAREVCSVGRSRTNTPLQALVLMNEPGFVEAARALGERIEKEGGTTDQARLRWGFQLATGRAPAAAEVAELERALAEARAAAPATAFATVGSLLLNLDEFVTRE